jgi:hypothetical protein
MMYLYRLHMTYKECIVYCICMDTCVHTDILSIILYGNKVHNGLLRMETLRIKEYSTDFITCAKAPGADARHT